MLMTRNEANYVCNAYWSHSPAMGIAILMLDFPFID
jgi:hypothetical protein